MPNAANRMATTPADLGLQLLTSVLMIFVAGLVALQLSVRFGVLVDSFDARIF